QVRAVAVHGGGGRVYNSWLPLLPGRRVENVDRARHVRSVAAERIRHRSRHGAHGRLMKHGGYATDGALDRRQALQVSAEDLEPGVAACEVQIGAATRREVIEDADAVTLGEQPFDDVRSDETRAAGHQEKR